MKSRKLCKQCNTISGGIEMIEIKYDDSCEMIEIFKNKKIVFEGNEWDLPRTARDLSDFFMRLGIKNKLIKYVFKC